MDRCASERTISLYLDGELAPSAAERLRGHLAVCRRCRRTVDDLGAVDEAVRRQAPPSGDVPDVASRVTGDLRRKGAFLRARLDAGKRRAFGESLVSLRMAAALVVAAGLAMLAAAGTSQMTHTRWARTTAPVLADAERVLVRLVYVDRRDEAERLAWARGESRKLAMPERLAEARARAGGTWSNDLASLETAFMLLAQDRPLPAAITAELSGGQLLARAMRLREDLAAGG